MMDAVLAAARSACAAASVAGKGYACVQAAIVLPPVVEQAVVRSHGSVAAFIDRAVGAGRLTRCWDASLRTYLIKVAEVPKASSSIEALDKNKARPAQP